MLLQCQCREIIDIDNVDGEIIVDILAYNLFHPRHNCPEQIISNLYISQMTSFN